MRHAGTDRVRSPSHFHQSKNAALRELFPKSQNKSEKNLKIDENASGLGFAKLGR